MQAVVVVRMFRNDPRKNSFLRNAAEPILRKVLYHLRQASILEALADDEASRLLQGRAPDVLDMKSLTPP